MGINHFTYLILLVGSIAVPLFLSFDKKLQYVKNLKYILPAIFITAIVFWVWDIGFTKAGVWSFNREFTLGINLVGMPLEEWLFFIVVPYCCLFIYEVLKFYLSKQEYPAFFQALSLFLVVGFALMAYFFRQLGYTFVASLFSSLYLGFIVFRGKFKPHMTKFYFAYFVSIVPFMVVNGTLTSLPVVEYNPAHILNIRVVDIPIEDFSYLFLMLLMAITIYETLKERRLY
jgi:lycopene cyclase domain-containing protein